MSYLLLCNSSERPLQYMKLPGYAAQRKGLSMGRAEGMTKAQRLMAAGSACTAYCKSGHTGRSKFQIPMVFWQAGSRRLIYALLWVNRSGNDPLLGGQPMRADFCVDKVVGRLYNTPISHEK